MIFICVELHPCVAKVPLPLVQPGGGAAGDPAELEAQPASPVSAPWGSRVRYSIRLVAVPEPTVWGAHGRGHRGECQRAGA